jgi:hypothetical protein
MILITKSISFRSTITRKNAEMVENPRYLQQNSTNIDESILQAYELNTTLPSNTTRELHNFHSKIAHIQYEGEWKIGNRNNSFLKNSKGYMKLQVIVYGVSLNGRQIELSFTIQDGQYKDNWYIIEQDYLYMYNSDTDSDISYNITNKEIILHDKNFDYRHSIIKAFRLFSYYNGYTKYYFDSLDISFHKETNFTSLSGNMYYSDLLVDINFSLNKSDAKELNYTALQFSIVLLICSLIYLAHNLLLVKKVITFTLNTKSVINL